LIKSLFLFQNRKSLLNYILHVVVSHLSKVNQSFWWVKKGGVERAAKQLQTYGKTLKLDSARHCQFWQ
jgi:16S rRNA (guanine1207-N2)-methyltransferase